ncbi:hypothetical protein ES708_32769 [subsurface metagenome]
MRVLLFKKFKNYKEIKIMKKLLIMLTVVAMASFLFVGCLPTPTPPNETPIITSDPVETATVGEVYTYDVEATDPEEDKLTYSLTVQPSGMIIGEATGLIVWTPPAKGDYAVAVKVSDGYLDITQSFIIVVEAAPVPEIVLTGIVVDPEEMDLYVGGSDTIDSVTATYEVRGYEDPIALEDCLFLTSDSKVAKVDEEGLVTAEGVGAANIVVSYEGKFDTLKVTVNAVLLTSIIVLPEEITLTEPTWTGNIGSITACYNDESTDSIALDDEDCTYKSSDEDVATAEDIVNYHL